jgi:hypothetical protein
MPNRIIKESICTSKDINRLSADEEVFWYRLIVNCDDHGYLDADPSILRAKTFPRRIDTVTDELIVSWLQALTRLAMVEVFEKDGAFYLHLPSWATHQQVRSKRSKYPQVDDACRILIADDITCQHLISDDSTCPRNPIQSNPIRIQSESEPSPRPEVSADFLDSMKSLFPGVDVAVEWEHCQAWCRDKGKKPSRSRLMNWLKKAAKERASDGQGGGHSDGLPGNRVKGAFSDVEPVHD